MIFFLWQAKNVSQQLLVQSYTAIITSLPLSQSGSAVSPPTLKTAVCCPQYWDDPLPAVLHLRLIHVWCEKMLKEELYGMSTPSPTCTKICLLLTRTTHNLKSFLSANAAGMCLSIISNLGTCYHNGWLCCKCHNVYNVWYNNTRLDFKSN